MDHLIVIALVICIITGSAAIIHSLSTYKSYRLPELKAFILFISLYNFAMLLSFISQYILKNISSLADWNTYLIIIVIMGLVGFAVYFVELYLIMQIIWMLLIKEIYKSIKLSLIVILTVWIIFYGYGTYSFIINNEKIFLLRLFSITNKIATVFTFGLSIYLISRTGGLTNRNKKNSVFKFGLFYFIFSFIDAITIFLPLAAGHLISVMNGLFLNSIFLIYLKPFLKLYSGDKSITDYLVNSVDENIRKYNISAREKEVIEMIINGKSNKEIEAQLFISNHTVKNHIYKIFQKTGVKSRSQLIRLFLEKNTINKE